MHASFSSLSVLILKTVQLGIPLSIGSLWGATVHLNLGKTSSHSFLMSKLRIMIDFSLWNE